MKKLAVSIFQYILFLFIGLGLLWLVFRKIDLEEMRNEIRHLNYFWVVVVFFVGGLSHLARAIRWNLMINALGYKTNTLRTFYAVMIGYLANLAIPRIGEVTRCGILTRSEKIPVNNLIGTVISERIFDMITLLFITLLVILFQIDLVGGFVSRYLIAPLGEKLAANPSLIYILLLLFLAFVGFLFFGYYYLRPKIRHLEVYQRFKRLVLGFWDGIISIMRLRKKGQFLVLSGMIWLLYFLMTYLFFFAMQGTSHLAFIDGWTILSLGSFGFVAPVPGGIGAYHFIVKAILVELYGLEATPAASFATMVHIVQTFLIIILGGISYLLFFFYMKKTDHATS